MSEVKQKVAGSPFLYDENDDIVGLKNSDDSEKLFTFVGDAAPLAEGALAVGNSGGKTSALAPGDAGQVLTIVDGVPAYTDPAGSVITADATTAVGDLPLGVSTFIAEVDGNVCVVSNNIISATEGTQTRIDAVSGKMYKRYAAAPVAGSVSWTEWTEVGSAATLIDLTSAEEDYELQVGETGFVTFTSDTSIPLNVKMVNGGRYKIFFQAGGIGPSSNDPVRLLANNAALGSTAILCWRRGIWSDGNANTAPGTNETSFIVSLAAPYQIEMDISYELAYGRVVRAGSVYNTTTYQGESICTGNWGEGTTPWSSLGTITLPNSQTGRVTITREI